MLQKTRLTLGDGGVIDCEMYGRIGINVCDLHKDLANANGDAKLLHAFTDECLFSRFSLFELATNEFPKQGASLCFGALTDQKFVIAPNQRGCNFDHIKNSFVQNSLIFKSISHFLPVTREISLFFIKQHGEFIDFFSLL